MKKAAIWLVLAAASVAVMLLISWKTGIHWFVPVSILFMIGFHELGHLWMAKYLGYKTGGFYFIPGLGGMALIKEMPRFHWHSFLVWYAGPFIGLIETAVLIAVNHFWIQSPEVWFAAILWAVINLFNMLPALPLDGGMIAWSMFSSNKSSYLHHFWYYAFTAASLVFILLTMGMLWAVIIGFFGYMQRSYLIRSAEDENGFIPMTARNFFSALFLYFCLFGGLIYLTYQSILSFSQSI